VVKGIVVAVVKAKIRKAVTSFQNWRCNSF